MSASVLVPFYIPRRKPDGTRWLERLSDSETRSYVREHEAASEIALTAMRRWLDSEHVLGIGVAIGDREAIRRVTAPLAVRDSEGRIVAQGDRLPVMLPVRDVEGEYLGRIVRPGMSDDLLASYASAVVRSNGRMGVPSPIGILFRGAQWRNRRGATARKYLRKRVGLEASPEEKVRPHLIPTADEAASQVSESEIPAPEQVLALLRETRKRTRSHEQGLVLDEAIARLERGEPCATWDVARALIPDARRREAVVRGIERSALTAINKAARA